MTTQDLIELRKLAESAKPWRNVNVVKASSDDDTAVIGAELDGEFYPCVDVDCDQYYHDSKPLADYLAAMNAHGIELLDALEARDREIERLTNNFKVNLNALHKAADERDTLRAELAAIRAQDLHDLLKGKLVSMDVSTSEDDAYNRVFGRVCEVMLQSCGSEEDTILAIEESRNFASPATKDAGLVAALKDAATSLETISRLAGRTHYVGDDGERVETYMGHHDQVRGYATSRASVARDALSKFGGV